MGVERIYIQGGINTDSINEGTVGAGVGVTGLEADTIVEKTTSAGVSITDLKADTIVEKTTSAGVSITGLKVDTITEKTLGAGVTIQVPMNGFGVNPLGTIIAIGNVAAWALPASGAVKDGYALCNGQTFVSLGAGNYNAAFSGTLPTLNDSRFLMGSASVGTTGGQNSTTLGTANIPQMSGSFGSNSTGDHTHTYSGTTGNDSPDHTHGYTLPGGAGSGLYGTTSQVVPTTGQTGGASARHTHGYSGTTAGSNIGNHSHSTTVTLGTASPTALENRPLYFSVVYLMRVK